MKRTLLAALLATPVITFAKSGGIEASNYTGAFAVTDTEIGNSYSIMGEARLPVADYIGATLNISGSQSNNDKPWFDSATAAAGAGLLLRKYDLGSIAASYDYSDTDYEAPGGDFNIRRNTYTLDGTYYLGRFDLSASRSIDDPDQGDVSHSSQLGAAYYITDNLYASVGAGGMDMEDVYSLTIAHQPHLFNYNFAYSVGVIDSADFDPSYYVSIAYFFGTRINLIERFRKY
jgi:hypothetical protein